MPSASSSPDPQRVAAARLATLQARLRRARRRAFAVAGASFVVALAAVTYQQHADSQAAAGAAPAATQPDTSTGTQTWSDDQSSGDTSSDDTSSSTQSDSTLEAPTTQVS